MSDELFRTITLAFIQGLSEFLPISSSAHLILPAELGAWPDQGLVFDVSVHIGTLAAVLHYFRRDLWAMLAGVGTAVHARSMNSDARLVVYLAISTIPLLVSGLLLKNFIDAHLRSGVVIALASIVFAVLLWLSDYLSRRHHDLSVLTWQKAVLIGMAQVLALIPGTSRSGITMSAALALDLDRVSASRYSFLMSIPAISGAGVLLGFDLVAAPAVNWGMLVLGTILSGTVAWLTIHYFLAWIERAGFLPFVLYRMLLGVLLLFVLYH